jgi:steroid delta-isomerase-like uncharacterized protein
MLATWNEIRLVALVGWIVAIPACATGAGASADERSHPMHAQMNPSNKEVVRNLYEVSLNTGDVGRLDRWIAPDFQGPAGDVGPAAFARTVSELRAAFPDRRYTVEEVIEEGDRVALRWTLTGTHEGRFRGFAPSGKRISGLGFGIFQLRDGKIVRSWIQTDRLGFLEQIGALPPDLSARLQPGSPKRD